VRGLRARRPPGLALEVAVIHFRFRSTPPADDDYPKDLATWQIAHNADRHDLTPDQGRRMRLHNRLLNDDLDVGRLVAVRWAVRRGLVNEWPTNRLEEIEGF
jgi:hypothetical protein